MANQPVFFKDPDAVDSFGVDWTDRIGTATISTSVWTVPTGITNSAVSITGKQCNILVSGGTVDTDYALLNRITTSDGRTLDQTITIRVRSA